MRRFRVLLPLLLVAAARGQIIVSQSPNQSGGPAADTDFINQGGQQSWQLLADDVRVSSAVEVARIEWFGFYHLDNPPATETMRIRFYEARPGDGLPGAMLREQFVANPPRVATGLRILTGVAPREFRYTADLATPFGLAAETTYWMEIVQLGDVTTHYRWESARHTNSLIAVANPIVPNWANDQASSDLAFTLYAVPEPTSCVLVFLGAAARRRRCAASRRRRSPANSTTRHRTIASTLLRKEPHHEHHQHHPDP